MGSAWLLTQNDPSSLFLNKILNLFSISAAILTFGQLVGGFRERWISVRTAAEYLKARGFFYRLQIPPFGDLTQREIQFGEVLKNTTDLANGYIKDEKQTNKRSWLSRFIPSPWRKTLPGDFIDVARQSLSANLEAEEYINGRLRQQRQWYEHRSLQYVRYYYYCQAGIIAASLFSSLWAWVSGRSLLINVLMSMLVMLIIAWRDFAQFLPLYRKYIHTSELLHSLELAYRDQNTPFCDLSPKQSLDLLITKTEEILSEEFSWWKARHQD
jgi:hypothetical protein